MDTIIYLYHSREKRNFITEKWQKREYCLIRLGIPEPLWKKLKVLEQGLRARDKQEADGWELRQRVIESERKAAQRKRAWSKRFGRRKRESVTEEEREQVRQEQEQLSALQNILCPLLAELSDLQTALTLLGDNPHWTYCVYEDFLREKIDSEIWGKHWTIPRFEEYHTWIWAEELMQYATCEHFLILGYAPCLGQLLQGHADRMRSVRWILKPEQYTEAVRDFIEEFCEEYGLAVSLQLLEPDEGWVRIRPWVGVAANVLDFTGEEKLSACDVAKGSVWLDMDSLEGKERRMEVRCPQIAYFSLKKHWKQLQKESSHLDTMGKNRYNT